MKYYVRCGTLRVIRLAESPTLAAMDAIQNHANDELLENVIYVDERGFRGAYADTFISLDEVMEEINAED